VPNVETRSKDGPPVTLKDLEAFHYDRLRILASSPSWIHVDLIAFETIPRLDEAIAIRRALRRIFSVYKSKFSYASFVFPSGFHLPWPPAQQSEQSSDTKEEDMKRLLDEVLGDDEAGHSSPLNGVGINCTKPKFLAGLVKNMTSALINVKRVQRTYLFVSLGLQRSTSVHKSKADLLAPSSLSPSPSSTPMVASCGMEFDECGMKKRELVLLPCRGPIK
jgi:hypothetical protein